MDAKPNSKPKPKPKPLVKKSEGPWSKAFLPDQGPKISGSSLTYTSASTKSMKIPEARA